MPVVDAPEREQVELVRRTARDVLAGSSRPPSWRELAELGWLGLLVAEEAGGAGWHPAQACAIATEAGRALDGSPWLAGSLAAAALASGPDGELRRRWLPAILSGSRLAVLSRAVVEVAAGHGERAQARLQDNWLWSRALTISRGSSEIMRNILAKRRLGLPSGRQSS